MREGYCSCLVCVCVSVHGSNLLVAQLRDKLVILTGSVSEHLSARHLILQRALGQCIHICPLCYVYVCPSCSSTHACEDGGGLTCVRGTYIRSSLHVGWMAEVRLHDQRQSHG